MSGSATRVLALLEVLQSRGTVRAGELATRLEVDERSVRRYVATLQELGIPVESLRGRYGGYRIARGYRLPPLMFSDDEAVAVAVTLATAAPRDSPGEPSAADRALTKLSRVLPPPLQARVDTLVAATESTTERTGGPVLDGEVTLTLAAAVRSRRRVRIDYAARDGAGTTREVEPYGLVVHGRRWYLVGRDLLREDLRTFRVDRVVRAVELAQPTLPPEGFDPVEHLRRQLMFDAWTHRPVVWLDTDLETARRTLPRSLGELGEGTGGGVVLEVGVEDLDAMARLLVGLPWRFEVREPAALTDAVDRHLTCVLSQQRRNAPPGPGVEEG